MRLYPITYTDASDTSAHAKQVRGTGKVVAVIVTGAHTADVTLTANGETVLAKTGIGSSGGTTYYPAKAPTTTDGSTAISGAAVAIVLAAGASFSCTLANGTANTAFTVTVVVDHN